MQKYPGKKKVLSLGGLLMVILLCVSGFLCFFTNYIDKILYDERLGLMSEVTKQLFSGLNDAVGNNWERAGIQKNTCLFPDPAFTLQPKQSALPKGFQEGNTIGLNLSPLIMSCETQKGAAFQNFQTLIDHIIQTTDMQIALIPHVVWPANDDRIPLKALYEQFADTGRVILIDDADASTLKGVIARCRFFIGARTHATIAAYSSCVPTLVVGYSIKAKGIAKDLFGTYDRYVLPVQTLECTDELTNAFAWLTEQETAMRTHLTSMMPDYIAKAYGAANEVQKRYEA